MIHTLTTAPRDMRTTGRSVQISNDLFNTQMIEPRILRVQPDPGLTIERLTGMHVSAGEIVMEIPTQIIPPAVIDRGHQATQQLNSNHTLRLLALIDTYRGPTRIQTSLVVPDQSDKPVPDQIDILNSGARFRLQLLQEHCRQSQMPQSGWWSDRDPVISATVRR